MSFDITWVEPDILAVGQMPQSEKDLSSLYSQGIRAIINLRKKSYSRDWNVNKLDITHIPVDDMSTPDRDQVTQFLVTVQYHFERGEPVYVHCTAGCGRSGTMIAIWLASFRKFRSIEEIIRYIREIRTCFIETEEQEEFVIMIAEKFL